jgi:hypothetical protein
VVGKYIERLLTVTGEPVADKGINLRLLAEHGFI